MTVCVHYARPASGQGESEIYGLDVAVTNLLSAWFRYGTAEKFVCRPTDFPSFDHFKAMAAAAGYDPEQHCVGLDPRTPKHNLENISVLFRPDPLIADLTWRRQQLVGTGYAACGVVHTMSGERIARAVGELCTSPSDGSDTLICPSVAIRDAVQRMWQIQSEYLQYRFGKAFVCPVQTPVIPLGVDMEKFKRLTTADKRASQRQALQAASDEIILLFLGRLSFATKAHPLALWQAAERAAAETGKKIRVVMYGYFKPRDMEQHYRGLAAEIQKHAHIEFITNDDTRFPDGLWAAADIFVSLSDNVQESFGLTPIEAMASGLPAIVSDWDGYRGSIRHGIDGFLIPTMTPPPAAGLAIAEAHYNEENYGIGLMGAAQSTAIDIDACAKAIATLASDDSKRRNFGANGRDRAAEVFDWRHIIRAYENLWQELAKKRLTRTTKGVPANWQAVHPSYLNPWAMFESFPSRILQPADHIQIVMNASDITNLMRHEMNFFIPELLVPKESMQELIESIRKAGAPTMNDVLAALPATESARIWRCIGWMMKHGIAIVAGHSA
jgi:glycosyltransferase involved in cell wall biosynthesis